LKNNIDEKDFDYHGNLSFLYVNMVARFRVLCYKACEQLKCLSKDTNEMYLKPTKLIWCKAKHQYDRGTESTIGEGQSSSWVATMNVWKSIILYNAHPTSIVLWWGSSSFQWFFLWWVFGIWPNFFFKMTKHVFHWVS
jgi:hypothetical protein